MIECIDICIRKYINISFKLVLYMVFNSLKICNLRLIHGFVRYYWQLIHISTNIYI